MASPVHTAPQVTNPCARYLWVQQRMYIDPSWVPWGMSSVKEVQREKPPKRYSEIYSFRQPGPKR